MLNKRLWLCLQAAGIALVLCVIKVGYAQAAPPDPRFILQTTAGLSAYAQLTDTLTLSYVRPLFSSLDREGSNYILGSYQLEGRPDAVQLLIHREGWALTYQPSTQNSTRFYDCEGYPYTTQPLTMPNRIETALYEVSDALEVSRPMVAYYDFRHPQAEHLILFWLLQRDSGDLSATLDMPLSNTYLEQGYGFCTVGSNSEMYINQKRIAEGSWVFKFGLLPEGRLRPGQTNTLEVQQGLSIFGIGLMGGVSLIYEGDTALTNTGGYRRNFTLAYPDVLGEPLEIQYAHFPWVCR